MCQRLIDAIEEAKERMYNENNIPKYQSVADGKRAVQKLKAGEGTMQEWLGSDIDLIYEIDAGCNSSSKQCDISAADNMI